MCGVVPTTARSSRAPPVPDLAGHHEPAVQADPHLQRHVEPRAALLDLRDDLQPGVDRALRVILVRLRVAEVREQPVARPLRAQPS